MTNKIILIRIMTFIFLLTLCHFIIAFMLFDINYLSTIGYWDYLSRLLYAMLVILSFCISFIDFRTK